MFYGEYFFFPKIGLKIGHHMSISYFRFRFRYLTLLNITQMISDNASDNNVYVTLLF